MNYRLMMLIVFIVIFTISGFSGLIYESIWSHYLKLFLGHASYAQVLVLVIFMGGMAIGAAIVSRLSSRLTNLILWYGIVECIIGIFGLTFHQIFSFIQTAAFENIFPYINKSWLVHTVKWFIGCLLILPQSILLGATFPLLTGGVIRRFSNKDQETETGIFGKGRLIATFYFVNSLGASIGILCNTFWFIPTIGLPGAVLTAGLINLALGILVYGLSKKDSFPAKEEKLVTHSNNVGSGSILLVVASLTGLASFMYEIGWIRMLTMVLGASTHSFELMLSAFIFGLAVGGFWIRKYIDKFIDPVMVLAFIQISMGLLAALTIPLYNYSYEMMDFVVTSLDKNDGGYFLYTLFCYAISLLIMLPSTICAGTTLPLVTAILIKEKSGDSVIGKVYAWNTVGSIIGILIATQVVMPVIGLKWVILGGSLIDIFLGFYLLYITQYFIRKSKLQYSAVLTCLAVFFVFSLNGLDTTKMASGVFRHGLNKDENAEIIFHKDGKTSTVAVKAYNNIFTLLNNGKADASIILADENTNGIKNKISADEPTMVMLGVLPYVYNPDAELIANIGLGSGLTAHTLLHNKNLKRLDTIEIEKAVYEAAEFFRPNVENLFEDVRSKVILEDAKTYFSASGNIYDVIVSEPPNPWVSGVSSLFSIEFYNEVKRYLDKDGVFVQWMHIYEISPALVSTIYRALQANFSDIHFYQISTNDIAIVASDQSLNANYNAPFVDSALKEELSNVNIKSANDIAVRKLADKKKLDIILSTFGENPNSDYFPILDLGASKTRFLKTSATQLYQLEQSRIIERLLNEPRMDFSTVTYDSNIQYIEKIRETVEFYNLFIDYMESNVEPKVATNNAQRYVKMLIEVDKNCDANIDHESSRVLSDNFINVTYLTSFYLNEYMQKSIYEFIKECESVLSEKGKLWIESNLAWLNFDYKTLYDLTNSYLEGASELADRFDQQLLILNLASRIAINDIKNKEQLKRYIGKMHISFLDDIELRGLLYLIEPGLVKVVSDI